MSAENLVPCETADAILNRTIGGGTTLKLARQRLRRFRSLPITPETVVAIDDALLAVDAAQGASLVAGTIREVVDECVQCDYFTRKLDAETPCPNEARLLALHERRLALLRGTE